MKHYLFCFLTLVSGIFSNSQAIDLPSDLAEDFIFAQDSKEKLVLVTEKTIYRFEKKWIKTDFKNSQNKKDSLALYFYKKFNNNNYLPININNNLHFFLNGGGFVLKLSNNELKRVDNSVDQKNQTDGAIFKHNNQAYIYGGYGLWRFKNYITYFDTNTGQWEQLSPRLKEAPSGRWKPLFQVIDNKFFVLGGRTSQNKGNNIDITLDDYFVYDLNSKTLQDKGIYNSEIPIKFSNNTGFLIGDKKAYANENELLIIDFLKKETNYISSEKLFKNLDSQTPIYEFQDTLYYISDTKNKKQLNMLAVSELSKFNNKPYPLINIIKVNNFYFLSGTIFLIIFLSWLLWGLFRYKDFLKELVLFDERNLYFGNDSIQISLKQHKTIYSLAIKGRLTALELNEIISSKNKFAKSHLTLLRQKFIKELNSVFNELTKNQLVYIIELKDPNDRRFLIYRANQEILKKPSFGAFLFKR